MEFMTDFFQTFEEQSADMPQWVHLWMNWMGIIFLAALPFIFHKWGARLALITFFVLTLPAAAVAVQLTGSIHWISAVHIILWPPLLYYLLSRDVFGPNSRLFSLYGIWALLASLTIIISLGFDIFDVYRLLTGQK